MESILFEVPILATVSSDKATGIISCTSPAPDIYLLTFNSPPDNRMTTPFCQAFLLALDIIEFSYPTGVVITTSGIAKFYSNGLDLDHARSTKGFFPDSMFAIFKRLLTYPMPTIALTNGHAFAGGLMLAMYHDYRIFNPTRGFLCLNELDFGVPLKSPMSSVFRQKVNSPAVYRSLVLEAKRFSAKEALEGGIVDGLGGLNEALALVSERKLTEKGKSQIYSLMKSEMYRESLAYLDGYETEEKRSLEIMEADDRRRQAGEARVKQLKGNASKKAKL